MPGPVPIRAGDKERMTVAVFSGNIVVDDIDGNITVVNGGEQVTIPTIRAMPWLLLLDGSQSK